MAALLAGLLTGFRICFAADRFPKRTAKINEMTATWRINYFWSLKNSWYLLEIAEMDAQLFFYYCRSSWMAGGECSLDSQVHLQRW